MSEAIKQKQIKLKNPLPGVSSVKGKHRKDAVEKALAYVGRIVAEMNMGK